MEEFKFTKSTFEDKDMLNELKENEEKLIQVKGKIDFFFDETGLNNVIYDKNYYLKQYGNDNNYVNYIFNCHPFLFHVYDYMSGENFLADVECGGFIDYDGSLGEVVVDGYLSNLGLNYKGIHQGKFKVSGKVWKKLCKEHNIMVNWANK